MARSASKPSISGICTSIRTTSKSAVLERLERLARRRSDDDRVAQCSSMRTATFWLTG